MGPEGPPLLTLPFFGFFFVEDTGKAMSCNFRCFCLLLLPTILFQNPSFVSYAYFLLPFLNHFVFSSSAPFQERFLFFFISQSFFPLLPFAFLLFAKQVPNPPPSPKHKLLSLLCCFVHVLFGCSLLLFF